LTPPANRETEVRRSPLHWIKEAVFCGRFLWNTVFSWNSWNIHSFVLRFSLVHAFDKDSTNRCHRLFKMTCDWGFFFRFFYHTSAGLQRLRKMIVMMTGAPNTHNACILCVAPSKQASKTILLLRSHVPVEEREKREKRQERYSR
jgi:hypothetical protein